MEYKVSINTLAYEGHDLADALTEIAGIGAKYVELGYTRGFMEGLTEDDFSETAARQMNALLAELGLSCIAFSAHIDLTMDESVDELKRRIDYGKMIGAKIVNTKVGHRTRREHFDKNIVPLARYAESMDIIIGLENPAEGEKQIINTGKGGAAVVKEIDSEYVRLNYDFGNSYTYTCGEVNPAEDYKEALPYAAYLHLKDMKKSAGGWEFTRTGSGIIEYDRIFKELVEEKKLLPMSIEYLFKYSASDDFVVSRKAETPELSEISAGLKASLEYVDAIIQKYS
ncbi:sugar phosphate isomerase/epimerase family protein [Thermodesulfobacteriota bacterium]